jgi:hypothetical protein
VVTIFGSGFKIPMQVFFGSLGSLTARQLERVVCVSPNASQLPDITPPAFVDVTVRNLVSGETDTMTAAFMYGLNLYISGNSPAEGLACTEVRIFGTGFEDPLTVEFLGATPPLRLEEQAISGTEIVAFIPCDIEPTCADRTGDFRVTLIERPNVEGEGYVEGGEFTLLGLEPLITSIEPPIVQETMGGWEVSPSTITIHGLNFTEDVLVAFDGPGSNLPLVMDSADVERVSDTEIVVTNVPGPNDFNNPAGSSTKSEVLTVAVRLACARADAGRHHVTNIPALCSAPDRQPHHRPEDSTATDAARDGSYHYCGRRGRMWRCLTFTTPFVGVPPAGCPRRERYGRQRWEAR